VKTEWPDALCEFMVKKNVLGMKNKDSEGRQKNKGRHNE
jgi:hypothetical protein